jgi:hypothetical protein
MLKAGGTCTYSDRFTILDSKTGERTASLNASYGSNKEASASHKFYFGVNT